MPSWNASVLGAGPGAPDAEGTRVVRADDPGVQDGAQGGPAHPSIPAQRHAAAYGDEQVERDKRAGDPMGLRHQYCREQQVAENLQI